jgi:hypothetical protein
VVVVPLVDVELPLELLLLPKPPSLLGGAAVETAGVVSTVVSVGGALNSGVLDVGDVSLRMAPEAPGSVTDVIVSPLTSNIGLDRDTVRVGDPGGFTSTVPPVKSRRSRLFQS